MMNVYADTNFLVALFCTGPNGAEAMRLDAVAGEHGAAGYPVTLICRLEFVNALQQIVYSTRRGVPGVHLSHECALVVEALFFEQLSNGKVLRHEPLGERLLERQFQDLAHRHTASEGFRTYDVLHVSCALALGCDTFLDI